MCSSLFGYFDSTAKLWVANSQEDLAKLDRCPMTRHPCVQWYPICLLPTKIIDILKETKFSHCAIQARQSAIDFHWAPIWFDRDHLCDFVKETLNTNSNMYHLLDEMDFFLLAFREMDLSHASLINASFIRCILTQVNFGSKWGGNLRLSGLDITGSLIGKQQFRQLLEHGHRKFNNTFVCFSGHSITRKTIANGLIKGCEFEGSKLIGGTFKGITISGEGGQLMSSLYKAIISKCKFIKCKFVGCDMRDMRIVYSDFRDCHFIRCDIRNTRAQVTNYKNCQLHCCMTSGSNIVDIVCEGKLAVVSDSQNESESETAITHSTLGYTTEEDISITLENSVYEDDTSPAIAGLTMTMTA